MNENEQQYRLKFDFLKIFTVLVQVVFNVPNVLIASSQR
jgi:hypothetical protein